MEYKWTALTVTTVGMVMAGIDIRILIIGLPTVAKQLNASAVEVIWITQSFQLAATVSLLIVGRISDIYGRVRLYNIGFVIFTLGSLLSAISFNTYELMSFIVIQGIGIALIITNSSAIVTDASPKNELGTLLGVNQTGFRIGAMLGLTLSGLILSVVDWRGLFYVNIPIGIFGTYWAHRRLTEISIRDPDRRIDWLGFVSFSGGLALVLLAITFLSYGSSALWEAGLLGLGGVSLLLIFVRIELKTGSPLVDFALFRIRVFSMGNIAQILYSLSWGGFLVILAFFLQITLGYSPFRAGIAVIPVEASFILVSVLGGKLSDKYGSRMLASSGLAMAGIGMILLSTFGEQTSYIMMALDLVLIGIGSALFITPNSRAIMGSVPENRRGIASAIYSTSFNVGIAVSYGLSILFLTIGIPYDNLSSLLQGSVTQAGISILHSEFLNGFRIGTISLGLINIIGIVPSLSRGSKETRVV